MSWLQISASLDSNDEELLSVPYTSIHAPSLECSLHCKTTKVYNWTPLEEVELSRLYSNLLSATITDCGDHTQMFIL